MLTVLSVAYPLAPVRPNTAGGAEQILAMLDSALTAAGHRSLVIACEGSQVKGTLIPTPRPGGTLTPGVIGQVQAIYRKTIDQALKRYRPDLIHLHGIDFLEYLPPDGPPAVATLHLPPSWYPTAVFSLTRPKTWIHCVSSVQRRDCPEAGNLLPTIENGVPEVPPSPSIRKRGFALSLGRICPEKGTDTAVRAARQARVPLLIAGEVYRYDAHLRYFEEQIKPLLDRKAVRFLGPVGPRAKRRLLTAAACVLIPSNIAETSSLVAMEAAMCGTPVVAFRMGALADIVKDGRTGFLVKTESELADAISRCPEIDPAYCRGVAHERFSERHMRSAYLRMYETLARE